ncbi:MAG: CvpA family protein [Oscillospiraceae bacterium]|nr:CvpA family protein [Oscillospiraceae bacterium]
MNTALVMDIAVGAVLVFGAVVKGAKGLYKYIMPLFVTVAAIIGALLLSRMLTPVVTEAVYPKVEDRVVEMMQEKQTELQQDMLLSGEADVLGGKVKELLPESLLKLGEKLGQLDDIVASVADKVGQSASGLLTETQKDKLKGIGAEVREDTEEARVAVYAAAFEAAYRLTETVVRWAIRILGFVLLYLLFTLLKNTLHCTVKLPVIGWVDKLGGAVLGVAECAAVLLIVGVLLKFFDIFLLHDLSQGTKIASFFFG